VRFLIERDLAQLGIGVEHRCVLDPLLPAVMVEQLVAGDPVDPPDRRLDATSLLQLSHGGEKRLLRQILRSGYRPPAAVQEVTVDPREGVLIEAAKCVRVAIERTRLFDDELHGCDFEHLSFSKSCRAPGFHRCAARRRKRAQAARAAESTANASSVG
jgi:hypothetical protein